MAITLLPNNVDGSGNNLFYAIGTLGGTDFSSSACPGSVAGDIVQITITARKLQ